jgi:hypothetical protein
VVVTRQKLNKNLRIWVKANFVVVELICRGGGVVGGSKMEKNNHTYKDFKRLVSIVCEHELEQVNMNM